MNWEALTSLGTVSSALVIAVTVIIGMRQLRLTMNQLEYLRKATQLEGAMNIFAELNSPAFRESMRFIVNELGDRMKDEKFRDELALIGAADDGVHKELIVMRALERLGAYVRNGLLDGDLIYDVALPVIVWTWEHLADVITIHRQAQGTGFWENFEYLYEQGKRWSARSRPQDYLKPVTR